MRTVGDDDTLTEAFLPFHRIGSPSTSPDTLGFELAVCRKLAQLMYLPSGARFRGLGNSTGGSTLE